MYVNWAAPGKSPILVCDRKDASVSSNLSVILWMFLAKSKRFDDSSNDTCVPSEAESDC